MKTETILEVQAYLDDELASENDVKRVANLLARDEEAARLFKSLKETRQLLEGNELPVKLPESGEFYWSKIARAIEREGATPKAAPHVTPWWIRVLAPLAGVACIGLLLAGSGVLNTGSKARSAYLHEIENSVDDSSGISFHSESQGMTVVWVSGNQ
jgi:anti-sigma factor RsiW